MRKLILLLLISSSAWAQQNSPKKYNYNDFNLIVKVEDKEKYYKDMLQEKPEDKAKPGQYDQYREQIANGWLAKGDLARYKAYTKNTSEVSFPNMLDRIYTLEYLVEDEKYLKTVLEVSQEFIDLLDQGKIKDGLSKDRMQVVLEVNAMANAKMGNVDVAKKNIARSTGTGNMREVKYFKDSKSNYLNRYAIVMSAAGENERALDTLTNAIRNADSNPRMLVTYKEVYQKVNGSDKGADQALTALQKEAYEKCYKEVETHFISDVNAPVTGEVKGPDGKMLKILNGKQLAKNVSIPDLNGKMVNFADYKGKILVIDFWTTGCTPCVAAFAGFEKVVADYKNDPFQLFVINLFEEQKTVKSFVAKKGISLDVLHDEPNAAYDIQATPTKIVFDPMGHIRFYSMGYAGSTDREYYKLKAMVELIKARAYGKTMTKSKS